MMLLLLQSSGNRKVVSVFFQRRLHESFQFFLSCSSEEEPLDKRNTEKNNRCKRRNQHNYLYFGHLQFSSSFCFFQSVRRSALYIAIKPSDDAIRTHTTTNKIFIYPHLYRLQHSVLNTHRTHRNHLHHIHPMGRNLDNRICAGRRSSHMLLNIPLSASKFPSAASH